MAGIEARNAIPRDWRLDVHYLDLALALAALLNTVRTRCQLAAGVDQKLMLSTASNVIFQVLYSGLLISNNGLHYVANRNDPNQLVVL